MSRISAQIKGIKHELVTYESASQSLSTSTSGMNNVDAQQVKTPQLGQGRWRAGTKEKIPFSIELSLNQIMANRVLSLSLSLSLGFRNFRICFIQTIQSLHI